ncbi:MAG: M50 family metallopeptidase [Planctomycetota bacterium]
MDKKVHLSSRFDYVISFLKWPAAWLAAILTPFLAWAFLNLVARVVTSPLAIVPFAGGTFFFIILWRKWLGASRYGRFLITLEHESTHALFALITWHRIVGFRASLGRGGEVRFTGKGNWLITAAPYFFPTAALLLFVIAYIMPFPGLPWQSFLLGVALGYHIISTYKETHRDQSDLKDLGSTFCWMFLPAANLAVVGLLMSFAHGASEGLGVWFADIGRPFEWIWPFADLGLDANGMGDNPVGSDE